MLRRSAGERGAVPLPRLRVGLVAVGLAVLAVAGSNFAASVEGWERSPDAWAWLAAAVTAGALAWSWTAPMVVLAVVAAGTSGYQVGGYPPGPVLLCLVFATFQVARVRPVRVSLPACGVAAAVVVAALLVNVADQNSLSLIVGIAWVNWLVAPWSLGTLVQVRTVAAARLRTELVERGALEERVRVAGEVHDVAGHGFSVIAMQAGVALLVLDDDPAQARESLQAIRATSTEALGDLRVTLSMMQAAETPGLDGLPRLAERVQSAGLPVDLHVESMKDLPEDLNAAVYRVVQESLTNVLRHAGRARAQVQVVRENGDLLVEIDDDGTGSPKHSDGRGLTGMRSRIEALGGTLTAGPGDEGGFRVRARIPVPEGAEQ
ncbi:sensor histidine kinase [Saccharopolyspora sp. 5N102]|uniref:sensor histidine kinase n=1 Tax=Saccharopolyspora sp. 5N102 TaxID=3375155 RepID=UPI00379F8D48